MFDTISQWQQSTFFFLFQSTVSVVVFRERFGRDDGGDRKEVETHVKMLFQ